MKPQLPWFRTIAGKEGVGTQDLFTSGEMPGVGRYDLAADIVW